jgi:hypothetical protein
MAKSPDQMSKNDLKDDSQGMFGFLKTVDKKFTVVYDETASDGNFRLSTTRKSQPARRAIKRKTGRTRTSAAGKASFRLNAVRRRAERAGSAFLGRRRKTLAVSRLERKQMKVFGYNQPGNEKAFSAPRLSGENLRQRDDCHSAMERRVRQKDLRRRRCRARTGDDFGQKNCAKRLRPRQLKNKRLIGKDADELFAFFENSLKGIRV